MEAAARPDLAVQLADLTAAKAALEAARDNAVRERDEARADRTRALALATEHLEAKAALEVQLRDEREAAIAISAAFHRADLELTEERAAHKATKRELVEAKRYDGAVAGTIRGVMPSIEAERDALAAQLKVAREALAEIVDPYRAGRDGSLITILVTVEQWGRARAALAASGPGKKGR